MTDSVIQMPGVKLSGQFVAQVYNVYTKKTSEEIVADNRILNGFFNSWFAGITNAADYFSHCALDSSAAAVTSTDTTITQVGPARAAYNQEEPVVFTAPDKHRTGKQYVFAMVTSPVAVNSLAIFSAASGGLLVARANLPSTLNLIIGDILTVKHYVTATIDLSDRTGTLVLGTPPENYPYIMRWINPEGPFEATFNHGTPWNLNTGAFGGIVQPHFGYNNRFYVRQTQTLPVNPQSAIGGFISTAGDVSMTTAGNLPTRTALPYVADSLYRDIEYVFPYNIGNAPLGIGNLVFGMTESFHGIEAGFVINFPTLRVPKDNTKEFRITFRFAWSV